MHFGGGGIQAQCQAADPGFFSLFQPRLGGQCRSGWCQRAAQSLLVGVSDQVKQIAAHHWVATGEYQYRTAEGCQPVD